MKFLIPVFLAVVLLCSVCPSTEAAGNYTWYYMASTDSCDSQCKTKGLECNAQELARAGSNQTAWFEISKETGIALSRYQEQTFCNNDAWDGPYVRISDNTGFYVEPGCPASCSVSSGVGYNKVCPCSNNLPPTPPPSPGPAPTVTRWFFNASTATCADQCMRMGYTCNSKVMGEANQETFGTILKETGVTVARLKEQDNCNGAWDGPYRSGDFTGFFGNPGVCKPSCELSSNPSYEKFCACELPAPKPEDNWIFLGASESCEFQCLQVNKTCDESAFEVVNKQVIEQIMKETGFPCEQILEAESCPQFWSGPYESSFNCYYEKASCKGSCETPAAQGYEKFCPCK